MRGRCGESETIFIWKSEKCDRRKSIGIFYQSIGSIDTNLHELYIGEGEMRRVQQRELFLSFDKSCIGGISIYKTGVSRHVRWQRRNSVFKRLAVSRHREINSQAKLSNVARDNCVGTVHLPVRRALVPKARHCRNRRREKRAYARAMPRSPSVEVLASIHYHQCHHLRRKCIEMTSSNRVKSTWCKWKPELKKNGRSMVFLSIVWRREVSQSMKRLI